MALILRRRPDVGSSFFYICLAIALAAPTSTAWINGFPPQYNGYPNPRFRSGGYGGSYGGATPYGSPGADIERPGPLPDERNFGTPSSDNPFNLPCACLGNNMVRALKNLAHLPPGSNTTFIPLGQVLIPTGKEMTFCRPGMHGNCGSCQTAPQQQLMPGPDYCPDYIPNDGCASDFDNGPCCSPCCYRRRFFAIRRRRSLAIEQRVLKVEQKILKNPSNDRSSKKKGIRKLC